MTVIAGAWTDRYGTMLIMHVPVHYGRCRNINLSLCINGVTKYYLYNRAVFRYRCRRASHTRRLSVVHQLVPKDHLSSAIALGSASFNLARFIGPPGWNYYSGLGADDDCNRDWHVFVILLWFAAWGGEKRVQNEGSLRLVS